MELENLGRPWEPSINIQKHGDGGIDPMAPSFYGPDLVDCVCAKPLSISITIIDKNDCLKQLHVIFI